MSGPQGQPDDSTERLVAGDLELLKRAWPFAKPDTWVFVLALALTPAIAAVSLAQPYLMKLALDEHIVPGVADGLQGVALMYLAAVVGAYILEGAYTLALAWGGQRTILRLREALYSHSLGLSRSFFDRQPAGKLLTRVTSDVESLGESLSAGVVTIALDLLLIVGTLGAMFWLDWRMTLLMLAASPPLLGLLELIRRQLKRLFLEVREATAAVNAWLAERVDGVQVVQLFGDEERAGRVFFERSDRVRRATQTANVHDATMYALVDGVSRVFVGLMLWFGGGLAAPWFEAAGLPAPGPVSVGLLVAFMDYLDRLFRPLRELSGKITVLQRAVAALSKIFWLLESGDRAPDGGDLPLAELRGHLVLKDVRFAYRSDGEDVLRGVDLEVLPGEVVALVGSSGSGKTSLTRLLDRSYAGYRGSITLDGVPLADIRLADLRGRVASVSQDIQVFSEDLRFNVDLDKQRITESGSEAAAALVHADSFIHRLGWTHVLRERGADLSVGEGQLLTFARTMAHDPDLIILDEATASVDSITEALVQDAIQRILERKTVIVIAHRLSTVQSADRIAVMDAGVIVEQGSHAELLAKGGRYAELVEAGRGVVADA